MRIAYASALGQLGVVESAPTIAALLREEDDETQRYELALALARLLGDEKYFVHLLRQTRTETGTALSQAVTALKKKMEKGDDTAVVEDHLLLTAWHE